MGAAAALMQVGGGGLGAAGAEEAADAKSKAAYYNEHVALQNANLSLQQSAEQERQQRVYSGQQIGQERADYGASGVSGASGSALDVLQASARNAELDALSVRHAGQMKAWSYQSGAALDKMAGNQAQVAGDYGAASSIFGGVAGAVRSGA